MKIFGKEIIIRDVVKPAKPEKVTAENAEAVKNELSNEGKKKGMPTWGKVLIGLGIAGGIGLGAKAIFGKKEEEEADDDYTVETDDDDNEEYEEETDESEEVETTEE